MLFVSDTTILSIPTSISYLFFYLVVEQSCHHFYHCQSHKLCQPEDNEMTQRSLISLNNFFSPAAISCSCLLHLDSSKDVTFVNHMEKHYMFFPKIPFCLHLGSTNNVFVSKILVLSPHTF